MAPRLPVEENDETQVDEAEDGRVQNDGDDGGQADSQQENDEGGGDEEGQEEGVLEADFSSGQPQARGRGERRVQAALETARKAREEADRAIRELNEYRSRLQQPQQESKEIEEARLTLMSPEQRWEYRWDKKEREWEQRQRISELQAADASDRATFTARYASNPVFGRYAERVEATLRDARSKGGNPDRETVLKYLLGEDAMQKLGEAKKTQTQQGQRNIQRQTTRPSSGRGDQPAVRRGNLTDAQQRERRLENVNLLDM